MASPAEDLQKDEGSPPAEDDVKDRIEKVRKRAADNKGARTKARAAEADLVERAREGDAEAFRKLVEQNQGRLFAVSFGMLRDRDDAMDVVQDTFIKAHRKLPDFEGNAAFSTWLYRICVNLCIDKKRAQARRKSVDIDDMKGAELSEDSIFAQADIAPRLTGTNPLKNVANEELAGQLDKALATLSEDHRAVILLREVEGMSYEEISQSLDIPKGTVMSRLFHARRNMQKAMRPFLGLEEGQSLGDAGRADGAHGEGQASDLEGDSDVPGNGSSTGGRGSAE